MSTDKENIANSDNVNLLHGILKPIRGRVIFVTLLAALGGAFTLVPLAMITHIASLMLVNSDTSTITILSQIKIDIWQNVIISLICLFIGLLLISLSELLAHLADNYITQYLRHKLTRHLASVSLGWFSNTTSGNVKQVIQDDIGILHELTAHFYTTLGRVIGVILVSLIYLFIMDWRMAIVSLVPYIIGFGIFSKAMKFTPAQMQAFGDGQAQVNNAVVEFVNGIPVVKTFGNSGKAHGNYLTAIDNFMKAFIDLLRPLIAPLSIANAIISPVAVLGVVLTLGSLMVWLQWLNAIDVLPAILVAPAISSPLMLLMFISHGTGSAKAAAQRVQNLLKTPILEQQNIGEELIVNSNEIKFENLCYSYDEKIQTLSNINFTLKEGSVTAIIGGSGAGKSTLARLLLRFFDPTEGRITLGGIDLQQMETSQLYRRIGFVLQEVQLIHASIRDNIALGNPSATEHEIKQAARAANIDERILDLPRGYDTVIGEDAKLSGGEQQRISIARAILLNPKILVLAEATAAADAESEVAIQEALSQFAKRRTLLVIAHRLDTIMHADNIIVMEEGAIIEQGNHHQLLGKNGRYAQLWALGGYSQDHEKVAV